VSVTYETDVLGEGNHASLLIPQWVLDKLQTNKRAPLKVTINGHTYQSTAVGVDGECRVVFPSAERLAANAKAGDSVEVTLELDSGYRTVEMHPELDAALSKSDLAEVFSKLSYSKRKEFARQINEAKAEDTRLRRIEKVVESLRYETPSTE
jgi:bifunctional DNA-binding transcriptional regulator/antitoxin component of YhaV-PrlF toxin-antitoxin module